jgi:ubiquinone/menaquinone biosynthesis C-methylase UbiE
MSQLQNPRGSLDEAEIQLLATLHANSSVRGENHPATLEAHGSRYGEYLQDWSSAYSSLVDKGLVKRRAEAFELTPSGLPLALDYHRQRPDFYWYYYQQFYHRAHQSNAHSRFCERAFGQDLCQEGMLDMGALQALLGRLDLEPGQQLLDLGCGAGGISEYIAEQTGAVVSGLDYSATAITTARKRRKLASSRLQFIEADLNRLELAPAGYHAAIAIDSIYWVSDIKQTISDITRALQPGGQLLILIASRPGGCDQDVEVGLEDTDVARVLDQLPLDYEALDWSESFAGFWPGIYSALVELKVDFEREDNGFIYRNWMREAETGYLPALAAGKLRRYLYQIHV